MQDAAGIMVGMHDFAAFAEKQELKKSTKVLVHMVQLIENEDGLMLRVVGSHFLWHMVRRMVGVLVEVGCHRLTDEDVRSLLHTPSALPFNHTAPPAGLFFERAFYDTQELNDFLGEGIEIVLTSNFFYHQLDDQDDSPNYQANYQIDQQ